MTNSRLVFSLVAVVIVAAIVGFALMQQTPPPPPVPAVGLATPKPAATPDYSLPGSASPLAAATPSAAPAATPGFPVPAGVAPAWEATIDQVLRSNVDEAQMAQMLVNILPTLPEDGQIEAANHITNLLPDSNYAAAKPLLMNSALPESVLSVFFTDLMNRDDTTKLNAFLDIAQNPAHPFHDEAISDLQIYVGEDYGTDWPKWKGAVVQYLKSTADQ